MAPAIILVNPREEGNIGAVARAMANMGLDRLILVEPAPAIGGVARGFGVGGWEILDRCSRQATFAEAVAPFRRLVGTTSARERPLRRARLLTARELPDLLAADPADTETALVFGPEDSGLTRRQIEACHQVVAIPTARRHPTLNLSQSVLLLAYELHLASSDGGAIVDRRREMPAAAAEVESFLGQTSRTLEVLGYDQEKIRGRWIDEIRRLLSRAEATSREVRVFRRLINRVHQRLTGGGRGK